MIKEGKIICELFFFHLSFSCLAVHFYALPWEGKNLGFQTRNISVREANALTTRSRPLYPIQTVESPSPPFTPFPCCCPSGWSRSRSGWTPTTPAPWSSPWAARWSSSCRTCPTRSGPSTVRKRRPRGRARVASPGTGSGGEVWSEVGSRQSPGSYLRGWSGGIWESLSLMLILIWFILLT